MPEQKRLLVIACEVMARELQYVAARSPRAVDLVMLSQGLHEVTKPGMAREIQKAIDAADVELYDSIALAYALCNNGVLGISARSLPVAIPRIHDCIAMLLGSHARYQQVFDENPGTYFYSPGWVERDQTNMTHQFTTVIDDMGTGQSYEEMVEQYGEDNAAYIWEQLKGGLEHYTRGLYIAPPFDVPAGFEQEARRKTEEQGWEFQRIEGRLDLLEKLLAGNWNPEEFMVLEPGRELAAGDPGSDIFRSSCGGGCRC